jgi:phosphatidylinositol alpha-mannosyltransferase
MAAGAPIVASDLDAFRNVLGGGRAGELFASGDAAALSLALERLLDDPRRRAELAEEGRRAVAPYDWAVIVRDVLRVYELAIEAAAVRTGWVGDGR